MSSSPFDRIVAEAREKASVDVDIRWKTPELPTAPEAALVSGYQPPNMQKLTIIDLDRGRGGGIVAQYNPKEIQVDKSASWAPSTNNSGNSPELQFTSTNARALTLELFFDTYETSGPGGKPYDVHEEYIKKLQLLTYVMNPTGDEWERRPPRVMVLANGVGQIDAVVAGPARRKTCRLRERSQRLVAHSGSAA